MSDLISSAIPALLNGVSQQTPSLRLPSQAAVQENALSDPVEGLVKRPATSYIANLLPVSDVPFVHTINRDEQEQYQVVVSAGDLKVFSLLTGKEIPVSFPSGKSYLSTATPRDSLKAITAEDFTFFLNKERVVQATDQPFKDSDASRKFIQVRLPDTSGYTLVPKETTGNAESAGTDTSGLPQLPPNSTTTVEDGIRFAGAAVAGASWFDADRISDTEQDGSVSGVFGSNHFASIAELVAAHKAHLEGLYGKTFTPVIGAPFDKTSTTRLYPYSFVASDGQREPNATVLPPTNGTPTYRLQFNSAGANSYQGWPPLPGPFNTLAEAKAGAIAYMAARTYDGQPITWDLPANLEFYYGMGMVIQVSLFDHTGVAMYENFRIITSTYTQDCAPGYAFDYGLNACIRTGGDTLFYYGEATTHQEGTYYFYLKDGVPVAPGYDTKDTQGNIVNPGGPALSSLGVNVNGKTVSVPFSSDRLAPDYLSAFKTALEANKTVLKLDSLAIEGSQLLLQGVAGERLEVSSLAPTHVKVTSGGYTQEDQLFIVVNNGVAEQTYDVSIDGNRATYTAGKTTEAPTYKTDTIAESLRNQIAGWPGFAAVRYGNFIQVKRTDGGSLSFAVHDTWNDMAMSAMRNRVANKNQLPPHFVSGVAIEVADVGQKGGYYVHYVTGNQKATTREYAGLKGEVLGGRDPMSVVSFQVTSSYDGWTALEGAESGYWEECAKPYERSTLIPSTLPHALVRLADGTFELRELNWAARGCGDEDSVPAPSFVDTRIEDVFFFRNRLGLMTNESVLFSTAGDFFNFWPVTASEVLDSDPIDNLVSHTKVTTLRNTAVFNNSVVLFSDFTQFIVSSQQTLTPRTVSVLPSTEFESSRRVKPVTAGQNVFFVSEVGNFSHLHEYFVLPNNSYQNTANDVSRHVPKYLPGGAHKIAVSTTSDLLLLHSDKEPNALYVYKYLWNGEEKALESWSKWTFENAIENMDFLGSKVYLTFNAGGTLRLEAMDIQQGLTDPGLPFAVLLDSKVGLKGTYDATQGKTLFTLPYTSGLTQAVFGSDFREFAGTRASIELSGNTAAIPGDVSGKDVFFGVPYVMRYRFSPFFLRDRDKQAVLDAKLKLKNISIAYAETGPFRMEVTPLLRPTVTKSFTPDEPGVPAGIPVLAHLGSFRMPVMSDAQTVQIDVVSDSHFPCKLQSALWEAVFTTKARRV